MGGGEGREIRKRDRWVRGEERERGKEEEWGE